MVLEGVHLLPGLLGDELRRRCVAVEAVVTVPDADVHRVHFSLRPGDRPAARYLDRFDEIRKLQDYLVARAQMRSVAVIENDNLDEAVTRAMELVLDAVARAEPDPA